MPARRLKDWISSYMEYVRPNSESPDEFHRWAAIGTISGALQRKVYLRWGHSTIYPNQYIILVGPSGTSRKGEPITILRDLFNTIGLPLIGEDNTRESVIRDMRNATTTFKDEDTGNVTFQCAASTFAEELSVFTGYQNREFLALLTNWWDSRDEWKRGTKHQGKDELLGVCFNMVASTAPDWLPHILPREAVGGGFTSRVLFVVEDASGKIYDDPPGPDLRLKSALLHDLERISTLAGQIRMSTKCKEWYRQWYRSDRQLALSGKHKIKHPMLQGYLGRKATHARKVALALSVSKRDSLIIESADLIEATMMLERIEEKMHVVFRGLGKGHLSEEIETVEDMLMKNKKMKRSEIMRKMQTSLDVQSIDLVLGSLKIARVIETTRIQGTEDYNVIYIGKKP